MTYTFTTHFAGNAVLAPCGQTFCSEIAQHARYKHLTNLGEIGNAAHQAQGTSSDHNPFVIAPKDSAYPGMGYVRAVDLGGDRGLLLELRRELFDLYRGHDARIFPYGYCKGPDSLIFDWPPGTGYHVDTGDEGHLHISFGIKDPQDRHGWIPALDSRKPWGISTPITHAPIDPMEEIMALYDGHKLTPTEARTRANFEAAMSRTVGLSVAYQLTHLQIAETSNPKGPHHGIPWYLTNIKYKLDRVLAGSGH